MIIIITIGRPAMRHFIMLYFTGGELLLLREYLPSRLLNYEIVSWWDIIVLHNIHIVELVLRPNLRVAYTSRNIPI